MNPLGYFPAAIRCGETGSVELFGTGPGQVGGFTLVAVTPEPSTYALGALGVGLWWCLLRRRKSRA